MVLSRKYIETEVAKVKAALQAIQEGQDLNNIVLKALELELAKRPKGE